MYLHNGFGTMDNSIITYNEYPPFTACFQYILIYLKGAYAEDLIIISQNILYLSIIIPICGNIDTKKKYKNLLFSIIAIITLPLVLYRNFFAEILVDGFLGILFGVGLFFIYKDSEDIKYRNIITTLIITALSLTKTTGIALGILLFIL